MKYNSLFVICAASFIFFQFAPSCFVLLFSSINEVLDFQQDPTEYFWLLVGGFILFLIGYFITRKKVVVSYDSFSKYQPTFWEIGKKLTYFLFPPAIVVSIIVYIRIIQFGYGDVEPTTTIESIILYAHLLALSFLFAGYTSSIPSRKLLILLGLIVLPRFIISTSGPRFFVFQALLPVFFFVYPIIKSFIRKYILFIILFAFLLIVMPFFIGNRLGGDFTFISFYIYGSPILFMVYTPMGMFKNMHLVGAGLLYSFLNADIFGYKKLFDLGSYKIRMDWIETRLTIGPEGDHHFGTGGNPIYEAYTEGIVGYIILFLLLGFMCAYFDNRKPSMLNRFVFPHLIAKFGFFWRGTFVELIDRTIYYMLIYAIFYFVAVLWNYKKTTIEAIR